jgi:hypothetical protein
VPDDRRHPDHRQPERTEATTGACTKFSPKKPCKGWLCRHDSVQVDDAARLTADAVLANRLYILPHRASRIRLAGASGALIHLRRTDRRGLEPQP